MLKPAHLSPLSSTFFYVEVVSLLDIADPYQNIHAAGVFCILDEKVG